jgi:hypothetical protein
VACIELGFHRFAQLQRLASLIVGGLPRHP